MATIASQLREIADTIDSEGKDRWARGPLHDLADELDKKAIQARRFAAMVRGGKRPSNREIEASENFRELADYLGGKTKEV